MGTTDDRNDPRLKEHDASGQQRIYLVLSEQERKKGFVRPLRRAYVHTACGVETKMGLELCETHAREPGFYGGTYCCGCRAHFPVAEFTWSEDGAVVGS